MGVLEVVIGAAAGGYRVDVLRSPDGGEASVQVTLDAGTLLARRPELQRAVLMSSLATRGLSAEEEQVRATGRDLFRALLGTGELIGRYRAAERDEGLRIVLRVSDPVLAGLPWEAMYDETAGVYVSRRHQLVRHVGVPVPVAPLAVRPPLRILGIVSSPRGLPPVDADAENRHLTSALARLRAEKLVELTWAPSATWADLQDILVSSTWHAIHFIGHGHFDPDRDEGCIFLTIGDGREDRVEGSRLIDLLRRARPVPRLVVLNSCSSGRTGTTDPHSGTAAALVRGGITAVAAMQYEITDRAAIAFSRGFYSAIARGLGVDEAVSDGRIAILGLSNRTLEWVTPVLYLRGQESHLFSIAGTGPKSTPIIPDRVINVLTGHTDEVHKVAFSPDGTLLATASQDTTARLWRTSDGGPLCTLTGHTDWVWGVAFSPDGTLLATGGGDQTVRLWRVADGSLITTLTGYTDRVWDVAFSPDGTLLATTSADQTVRVWRVADATPITTLPGHSEWMYGLAFSPDGTLLAAISSDTAASLWRTSDRVHLRTLTGHTAQLADVAFSPDSTILATTSHDHTACLWRTSDGTLLRTLTGHTDRIWGVAFSPDGTILATTSNDMSIRLWGNA